MRLVKSASGKKTLKLSKTEWQAIGKKAGWMKISSRPLSDEDKTVPMFEAIINPSLRPKFPGITGRGWDEMAYKVSKGITPFETSQDFMPEDYMPSKERIWKWD